MARVSTPSSSPLPEQLAARQAQKQAALEERKRAVAARQQQRLEQKQAREAERRAKLAAKQAGKGRWMAGL